MIAEEHTEINIAEILKKPYIKTSIIISVIIIIFMFLTQSYWMVGGIKLLYHEYQAEDILPTNDIPNGIFILSGNYSYISYWINTSKVNCDNNSNVKLLVYSEKLVSDFKNVVVMDSIEGCK